jgi:hypothetical protein
MNQVYINTLHTTPIPSEELHLYEAVPYHRWIRYSCALWEPKITRSSTEKQQFRNTEVTEKLRISRAVLIDDKNWF